MTSKINTPTAPPTRRLSWNDPGFRGLIYQLVALAVVAWVAWFLVSNTLHNLASRNIATGFDFLHSEAGFAIGESVIPYTTGDTYGRAILVGIFNTLRVAVLGLILSTLFGVIIGIARLSKNYLVSRLASIYVELMRNIPLLLQLFFWYALISENMPGPRQAHHPLPGVFLSNRGLKIPSLAGGAVDWIYGGIALAILLIIIAAHLSKKRREASGRSYPMLWISIVLIVAMPVGGWLISGVPLTFDLPVLRGFNFEGGSTLSPEFAALLLGLVIYTTAFIAEVVRSGIQSVNTGQWEAADSLGLGRAKVLRLVVLPQALRVIVPPMTSQYLNLIKNSSLAVAIGYPDIVSVVNTTLNQTGQAIEGILIIMGAYLTVSLSISIFMNWYNRRIALVER